MLVIHPDECIDCALCVNECPVDAIFADDELPPDQHDFLNINAQLAETGHNITLHKDPLPEAKAWEQRSNKRDLLKE